MFPFSPPHFSLCLGKCFKPLIFDIIKVDFDLFFKFAKGDGENDRWVVWGHVDHLKECRSEQLLGSNKG